MIEDTKYKYAVAFSFLAEDEALASRLDDLLRDRVRTFLYSREQERLAGADGEKAFGTVFGAEARVVVVLYRERWGTTPFTRIEATAIRNRAYHEGYDFTVWIPLDKPPAVPTYVPKTRLWVGLERWGVEAAAGAIEARVQDAGGEVHEETVEEYAVRLNRQVERTRERGSRLISREARQVAVDEVTALSRYLTEHAGAVSAAALRVPTAPW